MYIHICMCREWRCAQVRECEFVSHKNVTHSMSHSHCLLADKGSAGRQKKEGVREFVMVSSWVTDILKTQWVMEISRTQWVIVIACGQAAEDKRERKCAWIRQCEFVRDWYITSSMSHCHRLPAGRGQKRKKACVGSWGWVRESLVYHKLNEPWTLSILQC